mgnify:CR=1 FL=1
MRAVALTLALFAGVSAMAQNDFVNHGIAASVAELRGAAALQDANGHNIIILVPLDQSARGFLLVVDVDSGETQQCLYPEGVPLAGAFASLLSTNGKFYTGEAGYLLEFDPATREFTFSGKPHAESGHFVGKSIIDGPDGLIWIGTHPRSHLVSYDPASHEFHDYGQLDPAEQYFNYLAYDDTGWFYAGIGTARMSLVACNPATGEKRQLLPDDQRVVGSASVYRGTDGKAYGSAGSNWYRLSAGEATPIDRSEAAPVEPNGQTGYGGRTGGFPDGRTWRVSLEDGWVEVTDPATNTPRRIVLEYESGGALLTSMVAGPDGKVYVSSCHPMHFVSYDPAADRLTDLGAVANVGGGNFCDMATQGHYICAPSYSSGIFHLFDTTRPFNGGFGEDPNPRELARWPQDISRPRATIGHPDGRHIFMAGFAGYGRVGGGLGIYDLQTEQATLVTHENLIPNQSTIALRVLPDDNLVGGTSIEAPGGGHPLADEAVIYVYDWQAGRVLCQIAPVPGARAIVNLEVDADGKVYGVASGGQFFVFDPATREIIHRADLSDLGGALRSGLSRRPDGRVYAIFSRAVARIEPGSFAVTALANPPVPITAGLGIVGERLYFCSGASIWSYRLPGD